MSAPFPLGGDNENFRLKRAIRNGESLEVVQNILGDTETDTGDLANIIVEAITSKDVESDVVCALIEHDPTVARIRNDDEEFLLHIACYEAASLQALRLLVGMNPNALAESIVYNGNECFPIHLVLSGFNNNDQRLEKVQLFLSCRPESIRDTDEDGMLPLHLALLLDVSDEVILHLLACYPEAVRVEDNHGMIPLHYVNYSNRNILQRLVRAYPESITMPCSQGNLLLHRACENEERAPVEVIEFVAGMNPTAVNHRGYQGCLPLHWMLRTGMLQDVPVDYHLRAVQLLIELFPAALETQDDNGLLPIHHACIENWPLDVVELLLGSYNGDEENRGGLNTPDNAGRIPLHYAVTGLVRYANGHRAPWRPAPIATRAALDRYTEGVWVADTNGMLPLHALCTVTGDEESIVEYVSLLLEADLFTVLEPRHDGMTPLQLAFESNHRQTLDSRQFLLAKQDEALGLLYGAFLPTVERYKLPDLVEAEVWSFVMVKPWRPTREQMNA